MLLFVEAPGLSAPVTPGGQGQQPSLPSHETQALPVSQDVRSHRAQDGGKESAERWQDARKDPSLGTWETPVQQTLPRVLPSLGSLPLLGPHLSNERAGLDEIFSLYDSSTVIRLGSLSPIPSTASLNKTHSNWGIRINLCLN